MLNFPWRDHLSQNLDPNWQVKEFNEIFLNIMNNFIPNEMKKLIPRNLPWINKSLKSLLRKKNRLFKNFKKHGYKDTDRVRLNNFRIECQNAVEKAKLSYLSNLGSKLNNSCTTMKNHWKIINRVIDKCRPPKIPPLLHNGTFILNCADKAKLLNDFF